jgi:hypothetical protein
MWGNYCWLVSRQFNCFLYEYLQWPLLWYSVISLSTSNKKSIVNWCYPGSNPCKNYVQVLGYVFFVWENIKILQLLNATHLFPKSAVRILIINFLETYLIFFSYFPRKSKEVSIIWTPENNCPLTPNQINHSPFLILTLILDWWKGWMTLISVGFSIQSFPQ